MSNNLDEFKRFVKQHPGLNNLVVNKSRSWQDIYEEWTFYKDGTRWDEYKDPKSIRIVQVEETTTIEQVETNSDVKEEVKSSTNVEDMMKNCLNYVKKINPDTITKTVTNAQKLLALVSGLGIGAGAAAVKNSNTGDPLFDKRFDEWY